MSKDVLIVYFSGTGGTRKIAYCFRDELIKRGHKVNIHSLDLSVNKSLSISNKVLNKSTLLIVLFPVYAFDAPLPIFEWINSLPEMSGKLTSVISVSGGGEIFVNKSCRKSCIAELIKRGCNVFYERMMVMPSNFAFTAKDSLNNKLLTVIPSKIKIYVDEILNEKVRRNTYKEKTKKSFGEKSHNHIKKFGLSLHALTSCSKCNYCIENCPRNNISLIKNEIVFKDKCIMCMRCIYGCKSKSISSKKYKFTILKDGYDISKMEKKANQISNNKDIKNSILWKGAIDYLKE